ncbi:MAG: S8 family serine peptidase, partial [Planctomycetota bacterium]|nr:S8 family serine peptidase [Planctomycetota bacterium]
MTGQVVLLGEGDAGGNVPDLRLDDFVSAVRAVFGSAEDPGVTLDPVPGQESNVSVPQIVGLFGGLEDTDMGWVVLEADRVMKTLSAGKDNVSGASVSSSVADYKSMLQRFVERAQAGGSGNGSSRFWFVPTDVKLVRSPNGDSFVFDQTAVKLNTEDNFVGNGATDPDAEEFAKWFTDNYDLIAQEEYTVYDYPNETVGGEIPSQLKIFERLEQVAKATSFARFLYDNNIPIDFSWIETYEVPVRNTPLESRTVQNSQDGGNFTITITGGVTMDAANAYVPGNGATALSNGVLGNRPDELTQQWDVNFNNQDQSAVALQLDSGFVDGQESRADVDLSYQTPGDIPFELTRYYRSVEPTSGPFGFGWRFVPFDIDFNRPEFYSSSRSPFEYLNGLHEGEIRIVDNTTGQVLTFETTFLPRKVPGGGFGLNQRALFTASDTLSSDLDSGSIPQALADKFTGVGQSLSAGAAVVIESAGSEWQIVDGARRFDVSLNDNPDSAEDFLLVTSGLTDDNVPLFIPGGSEQPDGSTLTQEAGTLNYILTRPDETQLVFDSRGRLIQRLDSRGRAITYAYTGNMVTSISDDAGQTMTLAYDAQERVTQAVGEGGEVATYTYDANGDLATATRARQAENITYGYQYDADHRITLVTMPDQVVDTTSVTDILGRVSQSGDARSNQFHSDFDPATRTTTTTDMQSGTTVVERTDSQGRPVQSTDELGRTRKFFYDVVRVFAGNYDPVTNPNAWSYVLTAGSNRQPSLVISPDPTRPILFFEYDANGNVTRSEDIARGGDANQDGIDDNPLLFVYDANNNLVASTDARRIVTQYTYEVLDAGTPAERTTNRQTSMTRAVGTAVEATWNWTYDPITGYLVQQTDPSGTVTEYAYDALGNQTSQTVAPGTAGETVMSYTYDAFSRRLTETDNIGRTTTFSYDGRDRLLSTTLQGPPPLAFSSTYEAATGRKLTDTDFNTNLTQYTYDATTGDLTEVDEEGAVTKFDYDRFGNLQRLTDPVGNVTLFEYDDLQRLVLTVSLGATPRILKAMGSPEDIVITFTEPIDTALIDNGTDVVVENSLGQQVTGTISFDATGTILTWSADGGNLAPDTYSVTLRSQNFGDFQGLDATLLDGEYFGSFPTGDNTAGGDFDFDWLVDDHGNNSRYATPVLIPSNTAGDLEFNGDADWFSFDAVEGSRFGFEVVFDSLLDSVLRLYDLDGETLLELNDDVDAANGEFNSRIDWEAPRTGTFYLSVRGFADQRTGTYQLNMEALADDHSDDPASATEIEVPSVTPGHLELSSDADVFSFAATAGEEYRITTILDGLENALEDSFITILDTDGLTPLATNNNFFTGNPAAFLFWQAPTTDTYFIAVTSFNKQHDGLYELAVSVDDHGDYTGVATTVAVDSQTAGDLEVKGDDDWFSIAVTAGNDYRFDVLLGTLENSRLVLVGSNETTVLDVNDDYNGLGSSIFWNALTTETYYLRVDGFDGAGTYTFGGRQLIDDHGNDSTTATAGLVPSTTAGDIEMPGDVDWFSFNVTDGVLYRIETSLVNLPDSALKLYDTDGQTVLEENDDFRGLRSRIDWRAPADGTYFAEVLAVGAMTTGTYSISVTELEEIAPTGSLVSPTPGTLVVSDQGYVEIAWADVGLGIDTVTIDKSDITITGVTVTGVEDRGSGVWRYSYSGDLPDAVIEVTLLDLHVADLAGNWNTQTVETFTFDSRDPTVQIVPVSPDPRSDAVGEIQIVFDEIVNGFGLNDLQLTLDGGANLLTAATLTTSDNMNFVLGNLTDVTGALGSYQLTLNASASGIVDTQSKPLANDGSENWEVLPLGRINGIKFHDLNANGQRDTGEPGIEGWVIYLDLNNDRELDADEPWTTTGADGSYSFTDLQPATYTVAEQPREDWVQTLPYATVGVPGGAAPLGAGMLGAGMLGARTLDAGLVARSDISPPDTLPPLVPAEPPVLTTTGSQAPVKMFDDGGESQLLSTPTASQSLVEFDEFWADPRFSGINGRGYSVVVLDSGIDLDHPFFGPDADGDNQADRIIYQYDFANNDNDASDNDGHGSHVSSIIASSDDTYGGIAPAANIIHLKVFTDSGEGSFAYTEAALQWVVANAAAYNVVSVNMSLGDVNLATGLGGNYFTSRKLFGIDDELEALATMGILPVAAAGNDFFGLNSVPGVAYPAADPNAIAVGAVWNGNYGPFITSSAKDFTTGADRITSFSQRHDLLTDIFAPGAFVTGANDTGGTLSTLGTSQATPQIAGIAVLAQQLAERELGRRLTFQEFVGLLRSTAVTINDGDDEDDNVTNTGLDFPRVDMFALGEAILAMAGPADGTYEVMLELGETATANFGNVEVTGWAERDGQAGSSPDDSTEDVAIDPVGNRIFIGNRYFVGDAGNNPGDADFFVVKQSPSGAEQWQREIVGSDDNRARRVAADSAGGIYVAGSFKGAVDLDPTATHPGDVDILTSAGSYDAFLMKLNADGVFQWAVRLGGSSGIWDRASGLAVDASNNVYITGEFGGTVDFDPAQTHVGNTDIRTSRGAADIFAAKYSPEGVFLWAWSAGGAQSDSGIAASVDSRGHVHLTAGFQGDADFDGDGIADRTSAGSSDVALIELNSAGELVRFDTFGGTGFDQATATAIDESGNRFVSGLFQSTVDFDPTTAGVQTRTSLGSFDAFVLRLGPTGSFDWVRQIGGTLDDRARDLSIDSQGDILVTGYFSGTIDFDDSAAGVVTRTSQGEDAFLVNFNAAGELRRVEQIGGTGDDRVEAIATDQTSAGALAGFFNGTIDVDTGNGTETLASSGGKDALLLNLLLPTESITPTGVELAAISDTGSSSSDRITRFDNSEAAYRLQFKVQGTIPGATVDLFAAGTLIGSSLVTGLETTVLTNGTFDLTDGIHSITATQIEPGKTESEFSPELNVTIDTVAPAATINSTTTGDTTPPLNGTIDESTVVFEVTIDGASYTASNNGDGSWNLADDVIAPPLKVGVYDVILETTDLAGNVRSASNSGAVTITATLSIAKTDGTEGGADGSFTITQSAVSSTATVVSLTVGGTATSG